MRSTVIKTEGESILGFEYKDELKELLSDYMEILEEQDKTENRGDDYWVCPFCGSGEKRNFTAAFHINGTKYNCFSCGEHGDIFDLVGYIENLPNNFIKHYNRTLKIMRPYLDGQKTRNTDKLINIPEKPKIEDYTDYLLQCHKNVVNIEYFKKRGLSKQIIDRFKLGYDAKKNLVTIPYNPDCKGYVHRLLWNSDNKYCKFGNEIFNVDALYSDDSKHVFITEGQIDAMSFEEIGFHSIGLGGVNEVTKLVNRLKEQPSSKILVLALDNDKAGRKATGKFIEEIAESELDQKYIVDSGLYGKYKDANEFLIADREGFKEKVSLVG